MTCAELSPETQALLTAIRDDTEPIPARQLRAPEFRRLMLELAKPYLNQAGMLLIPYKLHLTFCGRAAGLIWRYAGNVLFYELTLLFVRWIDYGLSEKTLAGVLATCYNGLKKWQPDQAPVPGAV